MVAELRRHCAAAGSEIALHGFTHRTSPRSMPKRREYFEFRDESAAAQAEKLAAGLAIVERALGVRPVTFIPPWNRMDRATARACQQTGLTIASAGVYTPVVDGVVGLGTDCDLFNFPEFFERALRSERRVFLRILFHSRTTRTAEEIAALERALQLVTQTPGCKAMTLAAAVERFRDEILVVNEAGKNVAPQDMVCGSWRSRIVPVRSLIKLTGCGDPLACLYGRADAAYRDGNYQGAAECSAKIEWAVFALALGWFLILCIVGLSAGSALAWVTQSVSAVMRVYLVPLAATGLLIGGETIRRRATSHGTREFCFLSTFFLVGFVANGILLFSDSMGLPH